MRIKPRRSGSVYRMLILSYIAILFVSMLFASFGYRRLYQDARRNTEMQIASQLTQSAYVVDGYVESIRQSLSSLAVSTHVESFVHMKYPMNADNYYALVQTIQEIKKVYLSNKNLTKLSVYVSGIDSMVSSTNRMTVKDYFAQYLEFENMSADEWREEISAQAYFATLPAKRTENGTHLIGFLQSLPITSVKGVGSAVAYMDVSLIEKVMESGGLLKNGSLLIECAGTPILTIGDEELSALWKKHEDGRFDPDIPVKSHLTVSVKGNSGWTYHCALSSSVYLEELEYTKSFIAKMLLLELAGGALFSLAIARASYSPLRKLVKTIAGDSGKKVRQNEYELILNTTADVLNHNSALTDRLKMQEPMIKSSILQRLLTKQHGMTGESLRDYGIHFPYEQFCVLMIALTKAEKSEEGALISYSLISLLEDKFREGVSLYAVEGASDSVYLIVNADEGRLSGFAEEVLGYIESRISVLPMVCTGGFAKSTEDVHVSASQAAEAMDYAAAWNKTGVTRYEDLKFEQGMHILTTVQEQEISMYLRAGDEKSAAELVGKIFEKAQSEPLAHIRLLTCALMTTYLRVLSEWKIRLPLQEEIEKMSASPEGEMPFSDMLSEIKRFAVEIARTAGQFKRSTFDDVSEKLTEIIRAEYGDNALSLTMVAQKLNMNSSYLSHAFKQQSGISFIDAVNGMRMEKAKELLRTTDLSVQEISEKCGYTSANYFIRVFKKQCGQTPVQYKTDIGQRSEE